MTCLGQMGRGRPQSAVVEPKRGARPAGLTDAHLRILRTLARAENWLTLPELCNRAAIAKPSTGRVYLCRLRSILGSRVTIDSERDRRGYAVYMMTHLDDGVLPRCPHCCKII